MKTRKLEPTTLRIKSEEIGYLREDGFDVTNIVNTLMIQQHGEHITNVHDVANSMLE